MFCLKSCLLAPPFWAPKMCSKHSILPPLQGNGAESNLDFTKRKDRSNLLLPELTDLRILQKQSDTSSWQTIQLVARGGKQVLRKPHGSAQNSQNMALKEQTLRELKDFASGYELLGRYSQRRDKWVGSRQSTPIRDEKWVRLSLFLPFLLRRRHHSPSHRQLQHMITD